MLITEIERFIKEDIGYNDISCTMVPDKMIDAVIFAKEDCTLAGLDEAKAIFDYFNIKAQTNYSNGDELHTGDIVFTLRANAVSVLRSERLVLNFLGHLSGIATITRRCVNLVRLYSTARVACTRKTTPGIRKFEKMAVVAGGGDPHRFNLSDAVMI